MLKKQCRLSKSAADACGNFKKTPGFNVLYALRVSARLNCTRLGKKTCGEPPLRNPLETRLEAQKRKEGRGGTPSRSLSIDKTCLLSFVFL